MITLDTAGFNKYASGKNRPYSLILFGDARQLRKKGKLDLDTRFNSFSTVAKAFASTHAGKTTEGKVFFIRMLFEDARDAFGRLGVKGLPYVSRIPPNLHIRSGAAISMPKDEELLGGTSAGLVPQDVGSFVQERTGLSPGDLSAAGSASRSRLLPLFTLAFLAGASFIGYKLYYAPFMQSPSLYAAGAMAVIWFSTSGGMYNIIRGVPFVGYDPRTKAAVLFTPGSGQMGAEGFIMGTFLMIFAMLVTSINKLLPTVKLESERRTKGWLMLAAAAMIFRIILGNHAWKTRMHSYYYF